MSIKLVNESEARESLRIYLGASTYLSEWPLLGQILIKRLEESPSTSLLLPFLACEAAGGLWGDAIPVAASWMTIHEAALVLNAVQDQDTDFYGDLSIGEMINLSTGFISAGFSFSSHLPLSSDIFSELMFYASLGNNMLSAFEKPGEPNLDGKSFLEKYWEASILRSGSIYRAAAAAGAAVSAGSMNNTVDLLGDYGTSIGVILQIFDDCRDVLSGQPADSYSLPWILYFDALGQETAEDIEVTREMLVESGIQNQIAFFVFDWQKKAKEVLNSLRSRCNQEALNQLETIIPVPRENEGEL